MTQESVRTRFVTLSSYHPNLGLYALVDGIQYKRLTGKHIEPQEAEMVSLFKGTEDEPLAHAGPWLMNVTVSEEYAEAVTTLEKDGPGVVWLIAEGEIQSLAAKLRLRLNARLRDGRELLLRFWDPRALNSLYLSMRPDIRREYFSDVLEWHYILGGKRFYIDQHA